MLRLLCPQWVFDNYEAVTPEFLKEHGVKLLLADLDFTLAPKSQSEPDESLTRWIGALKEAGIEFAILSNNRSPVRVEKFCKPLKVGYVGHAGKPGTRGFHEAMARYGVNARETAMLGDKLLTDTLGARRSGVLMLMVEPRGGAVGAWNHVLHALQRAVQGRKRARRAEKALKFANFTHNIKKNTCIAALYAVKYHRFRTDTL